MPVRIMLIVFAATVLLFVGANADTPANCTYQDIVGNWTFYEGDRNNTGSPLCDQIVVPSENQQHFQSPDVLKEVLLPSVRGQLQWKTTLTKNQDSNLGLTIIGSLAYYRTSALDHAAIKVGTVSRKVKVALLSPNVVVDEYGNKGTWTVVYNQGFEVTVNGRTFFAFSYYKQDGGNVTSICSRTFPGWSHDVTLHHWACYYGRKQGSLQSKLHQDPFASMAEWEGGISEEAHQQIVERVNSIQSSWTAKVHRPFLNYTHQHLLNLHGGKRSWLAHRPSPSLVSEESKRAVVTLPESLDWRNKDGVDYVSPVRNQGTCGSCYAFSSMGMLESRLRVRTNNQLQVTLSPQDIVSCSHLAQGCAGGFPYLIAGKYGKEFGVVEETCIPYSGRDDNCPLKTCADRHYTAEYRYVGGYYGACNEEEMLLAIQRGPIAVSFEVYEDFDDYSGGIYHYTGQVGIKTVNSFEIVNHAVLAVGYGVDNATSEKFWIVKNSWGQDWGEDGYFRIRRGTDEVGIESIAVEVEPIPY
uniref:Dipeptidyl peptidase 1 n=1 Tax=Timema shepardi TaxID=629360 RepID=A0A7R9FV47_TIMSH|nr:unnamed protein product [Timema shepardi]